MRPRPASARTRARFGTARIHRAALTPRPAADIPAAGAAPPIHTPAEAVRLALADVLAIPDRGDRKQTRYLSLYNIPPARRAVTTQVVNVWLNSLSGRNRVISPAAVVPGSDGTLLRVSLACYSDPDDDGQDLERLARAWDSLGANGSGPTRSLEKIVTPEPYFHLQVDQAGKAKNWLVHGPWLPSAEVLALSAWTHTFFPVLRADWFVANASLAPAYYELIGVKTLDDVKELALFDQRAQDRMAVRAIQAHRSEVALHNRAVSWAPTATGNWFETFDFAKNIRDADLLVNVLQKKRDASEIIGNLLNGLQFYALVNGQDKIIDLAGTNVARDKDTAWSDPAVWNAASCVHCHTQGIKFFDDTVRSLVGVKEFSALVPDPHDARQFAKLWAVPIDVPVRKSQVQYTAAIAAASGGMTPPQFVAAFQQTFLDNWENDIYLDTAAADAGLPPADVMAILQRTIVGEAHTLTQVLRGDPVRPDQWQTASGVGLLLTLTSQPKGTFHAPHEPHPSGRAGPLSANRR